MALELKGLVEHIARMLVDDPSQVQVVEVESVDVTVYEIRVAPEDVGRMIGKEGRTVAALCRILRSVSGRQGKRVEVRISRSMREGRTMGRDVFLKDDVLNAIRANVLTCILAAVADGAGNVDYVRGSLAMGHSLAVSFGLDWSCVLVDLREQAQLGGWCDLLDAAGGDLGAGGADAG